MISTHSPFIVVCPLFNCNGDCKEEWYGAGAAGRVRTNVTLKVPVSIRVNKYRMTNVEGGGVGVWVCVNVKTANTVQRGRETPKANSLKIRSLKWFELLPLETFVILSNASPAAKATEVKNSRKKLQRPDISGGMQDGSKKCQKWSEIEEFLKDSRKPFVLLPQLSVSLDCLFRIFWRMKIACCRYVSTAKQILIRNLCLKKYLHFRTVTD